MNSPKIPKNLSFGVTPEGGVACKLGASAAVWYALFRASGGTIDSATSLNGVLKQDIINSKGAIQLGGVPGRKVGIEDFSGICPELTEVCKRKLAAVCAEGTKPKGAHCARAGAMHSRGVCE